MTVRNQQDTADPHGPLLVKPLAPTAVAVQGIFAILVLAAVYFARDFLLPVVFALLLFFVFVPVQRRLHRIGLPGALVAGAIVLSLLVAVAAVFFLLSGPVARVVENLPAIVQDISQRLDQARNAMLAILQGFRGGEPGDIPDLRPALSTDDEASSENGDEEFLLNTASGALTYLAEAPARVAQFFLSMVLLFFMLSSSDLLYLKIIQSFDAFGDKRVALAALHEVEQKLGGYLGTVAVINTGLGVCIGLAMWALGMPVPLLFGVLAFLLNFIPVVGAFMGIVLSTVVALLWFDTLGSVLMVGSSYLALTAIEGQLVTPSILARRLRMNTVLVFLSIAFWAWMWSFWGMLIAVPILVALRVITEQVPRWRKVANILSGDRIALQHVDRTTRT